MNIYGSPTCTFAAFARHLEHSPARVEMLTLWEVFRSHNIDPAVALGFFHHESACGTLGRAVTTLSWGNIRWRPVYDGLAYPVRDVDGFCAYPSYSAGARHFCEHLLGLDNTNAYAGLTTVEQVVPKWAPAPTNNPPAYIAAVERLATELSGGTTTMAKPRILHVAGHLRTQQMTEDGLCDGLDKPATVAALKGMTGTGGEQDFTSNMVGRQADLMNASGLLEARAIDCIYHKADYIDWAPNLVIAHHIHRDGSNRAMFAVPDRARAFHSEAANDESARLMARIVGGYTQATGIPITQAAVTLRMVQLYTWCYIAEDSQAIIPEYGNGNLDTAALFNDASAQKIAKFMTQAVLEHFNLTVPGPTPVPPTTPARPLAAIATDLEALAKELRQR